MLIVIGLNQQVGPTTEELILGKGGANDPLPKIEYKKGPMIGKGAFGRVFECLNVKNGELLAVKTYKVSSNIEN